MRLKQKMRAGASRIARAALAGVLAIGLAPSVAFADLQAGSLAADGGMDPNGQVIAAAYAAANPAPEILGLNNPNQRSTGEADQTYNFFGDPDINVNPDPYLYNYKNDKTPGVYVGGRQGSPMSALNNYNADDPTAAQNAVWLLQPHIILGTGADNIPANEHSFYIDNGNAAAVEKALGLEAGSYQPIGVTYNRISLATMIQTMYRLASAANEVINDSDGALQARYGDPMLIAQDYERYIVGQKGVVKQAIDTGKVQKKTIALIQSYDSTAGTYTIITDGIAEGTATTNRYLEAVQGVTNNYYDTVGAAGATAVTKDQLAENVDVIILGTASGTDNTGSVADYLLADGLLNKTFYCVNWANGSAFGTTVNSVENAQNVGRILPCVYPEVLDQSDMVAYYYETFYHLKTGEIARLMAERMDGVRNWDKADSASYTSWETTDYAGYVHDDVEALLKSGVSYLNSQGGLPDYLSPTSNVEGDTQKIDLADASITVPSAVLEGGSAEPEPVVTYGATTLTKGVDYTVSYEGNTEVGTATAVVTAVDGGKYTGSKSATFQVLAQDNFSNLDAKLAADSYVFTSKAIEPAATIEGLTAGTDFTVSYANNVNVGTAEVTLVGIGGYAGTITKTFAITQLVPTVNITSNAPAVGEAFSISTSVDSAYTNDGGKGLSISFSPEDAVTIAKDPRGNTTYTAAKAGEVTITATGEATANCAAPSASKTVTIKSDISSLSINKFDATYAYTGEEIEITPSFKDAEGNKVNLVKGTDYTITVKQGNKDAVLKEMGEYTVTLAGIGAWGGKVEKKVTVVPFFSVYVSGSSEPVKTYKTLAEFSSLKSDSTDPISALYNASATGWNVATTNSYVTLDDLLADAGVNFGGAATVSWEGKGGAITSYSYGELQATKFFPKAVGSATHDASESVAAPLVFALTQAATAVDTSDSSKPQDAAAAEAANVAAQSSNGCPRTIVGISEEDFANPSADGAKTAGMRLWNNINAITITYGNAIEVPKAVSGLTYTGKALTGVASGAGYTVQNGTATNAGTYTATVTPNAGYEWSDGTAEAKQVSFAIAKATVKAPAAKAGLVYSGKAQTGVAAGAGYTVKGNSATNAGSYTATLTADANHQFAGAKATATVKWSIAKANGAIAAKAKTKTVSIKAGKSLKASKAFKVTKNTSKGKVTYAKTKGNKKIVVAKNGKITVKKGLKAGKTYTIKVKVTSGETTNYKAATSKVITVKVKVK